MKRELVNLLGICILNCVCVSAISRAAPQAPSAEPAPKQDSQFVNPEILQGCYDLTMSRWFPDMKLGDDEALVTPPARIQLLAQKGTEGSETEGYLVRPAPGAKPSVHSDSYWVPKGRKSIKIIWTTGYSGLTMDLKTSDAEVLRGKASTFWDFNRRKQTAEVLARRVDCGKS
jgi:hypothetical protein